MILECSIFIGNQSPGGAMGIGFINVNLTGFNVFKFNSGPSLRVSSAHHIILFNNVIFSRLLDLKLN